MKQHLGAPRPGLLVLLGVTALAVGLMADRGGAVAAAVACLAVLVVCTAVLAVSVLRRLRRPPHGFPGAVTGDWQDRGRIPPTDPESRNEPQ